MREEGKLEAATPASLGGWVGSEGAPVRMIPGLRRWLDFESQFSDCLHYLHWTESLLIELPGKPLCLHILHVDHYQVSCLEGWLLLSANIVVPRHLLSPKNVVLEGTASVGVAFRSLGWSSPTS